MIDKVLSILKSVLGNEAVIIVGFSMLLIVVIFAYVVKKVTPVSSFLYSNARIKARSNYLISEKLFDELLGCKSLSELRSALQETDYYEELEKVGKLELKNFHKAVEKSFMGKTLELRELSPDRVKPVLDAYLMFMESKIIKTVYRAKFFKHSLSEELVFPVGNVDDVLLKHMLNAESLADLNVVMSSTVYKDVFSEEYKTIEEFEVTIDEFVFNFFKGVVDKIKMYEGKFVVDILNKKIDIFNILALLKFRIRGTEKESRVKCLVMNDSELSGKFNELAQEDSLKGFVDKCDKLPYHEALNSALEKYEKDGSMSHFETELFRFFKRFVLEQELYHSMGPIPLFCYLVRKDIEKRDLFIISRGIEDRFPAERIKEMIV